MDALPFDVTNMIKEYYHGAKVTTYVRHFDGRLRYVLHIDHGDDYSSEIRIVPATKLYKYGCISLLDNGKEERFNRKTALNLFKTLSRPFTCQLCGTNAAIYPEEKRILFIYDTHTAETLTIKKNTFPVVLDWLMNLIDISPYEHDINEITNTYIDDETVQQ
jgi:hypothetical protein